MDWNLRNQSTDGIWHIPIDCEALQHIEWTCQEFKIEPRNLKCGIALNGINPYGMQSTSWFTWPVMLVNYNIPPFMAIRKENLMLTLLILGNIK